MLKPETQCMANKGEQWRACPQALHLFREMFLTWAGYHHQHSKPILGASASLPRTMTSPQTTMTACIQHLNS